MRHRRDSIPLQRDMFAIYFRHALNRYSKVKESFHTRKKIVEYLGVKSSGQRQSSTEAHSASFVNSAT